MVIFNSKLLVYQRVNQKIETETQMIEMTEKLRAMDASTPSHPIIFQYIPYSMPILYIYTYTSLSLSLIIIIISHITSHITSQYRRIPIRGSVPSNGHRKKVDGLVGDDAAAAGAPPPLPPPPPNTAMCARGWGYWCGGGLGGLVDLVCIHLM